MNITQNEMNKINDIQFNIFKEFINVCSILNLKYYMVHGSLLGTLKYNDFFPFDDDIDIAMPRKDYNTFIREGQKYLPDNLFIQCNKTEPDYPLVFSKVRDSNTAFIQPNLEKFNVNQGIYIDIFPIDNYPINNKKRNIKKVFKLIYQLRVSSRMKIKRTKKQKIATLISVIICPCWQYANNKLSAFYANEKESGKCVVYGGKSEEIGIPLELFGTGKEMLFRKIKVIAPSHYDKYLEIIYKDYKNYSPAKKYMVSDELVKVSAKIIDTKKSYKNYIKER